MAGAAVFWARDLTGVADLARKLVAVCDWRLLAVGDAAASLEAAGCSVERIDSDAVASLISDPTAEVRLLVANFASVESAGRGFLSWKSAIGAFDWGLVAAIREAARWADRLAVVGNSGDFERLLADLKRSGGRTSQAFRTGQAASTLRAASGFDFAAAQYLEIHAAEAPDMGALSGYPKATQLAWPRAMLLEGGENRHQLAALYGSFWEHFELAAGPALDYEGVLSVSRAAHVMGEFEKPAAAVFQAGRLRRAASSRSLSAALAGVDCFAPSSLRGAWLAVNATLSDAEWASLASSGLAGVVAPDLSLGARSIVSASGAIRALVAKSGMGYEALQEARSVVGGALLQDKDRSAINPMSWIVQGAVQPLVEDWEALYFAARVARHIDSCGCVVTRGETALAIEQAGATPSDAFAALERRSLDLSNATLVFDDELDNADVLRRAKALGCRAALHPGIGSDDTNASLRAAANDVGMALLAMGRSLRRL